MSHTYASCIFYDSEFCGDSFENKNFLNPPTQIFNFLFSLECVGVLFFRRHIRIKRKISHRVICIDKWFISCTPTQTLFQIKQLDCAHAIEMNTCWRSKKTSTCSEGSITSKKSQKRANCKL